MEKTELPASSSDVPFKPRARDPWATSAIPWCGSIPGHSTGSSFGALDWDKQERNLTLQFRHENSHQAALELDQARAHWKAEESWGLKILFFPLDQNQGNRRLTLDETTWAGQYYCLCSLAGMNLGDEGVLIHKAV